MTTARERTLEEIGPVKQVFRAASSSRPGMYHYTFVFEDGHVECTCEGHRMGGKCWHENAAKGEEELGGFSVSL